MGEAWNDLLGDVALDVGPGLAILWSGVGQQLPEVTGLDGGHHTAVLEGLIVVDHYGVSIVL